MTRASGSWLGWGGRETRPPPSDWRRLVVPRDWRRLARLPLVWPTVWPIGPVRAAVPVVRDTVAPLQPPATSGFSAAGAAGAAGPAGAPQGPGAARFGAAVAAAAVATALASAPASAGRPQVEHTPSSISPPQARPRASRRAQVRVAMSGSS